MRIHELITENQLDEIDWKKGLATGAMALGALGSPAFAADEPSVPDNPGRVMPNQNLDTAEKVERTPDGIKITHGGKEYDAVEVPAETTMVPRGALKIKVQKAQMGFRSLGNFTTYLLPNGKAYIYSK